MKYLFRIYFCLASFSYAVAAQQDQPLSPGQDHEAIFARERLSAICDAMADWVVDRTGLDSFAEEPLIEIKKLHLNRACDEYLNKISGHQKSYDSMLCAPIQLGSQLNQILAPDEEFWKILMTEDQLKHMKEELQKREQRLHAGFVLHLINSIDEQLYLSARQRDEIRAVLDRKQFDSALLMTSRPSRLSYTIGDAITALEIPEVLFNEAQMHYLQALKYPDQGKISLTPGQPVESHLTMLDIATRDSSTGMLKLMDVQVAFLANTGDLSTETLGMITLAKQGALQRMNQEHVIKNWLIFSSYLDIYGDLSRVKTIGFQWPRSVNRSPLWRHILARWDAHPINIERRASFQRGLAQYLVSVLDQELWLNSSQRAQCEEIVLRDPRIIKIPEYMFEYEQAAPQGLWLDMQLLARFLNRVSEEEFSAFLSAKQFAAWKLLRKQFKIDDDRIIVKGQFIRGGHPEITIGTLSGR